MTTTLPQNSPLPTPNPSSTNAPANPGAHRNPFQKFWDMTILFCGISTEENLQHTRSTPIKSKGLFLFRDQSQDPPQDKSQH